MKQFKKYGKRRAPATRALRDVFESALFGGSEFKRPPFRRGADRKTLQLCRQVERALSLGLAGQSDELLRDLQVDSVQALGSAGHLVVRVIVPAGLPVSDVMWTLETKTAALRADVASVICRKRAPALSFVPIAGGSEVPRD